MVGNAYYIRSRGKITGPFDEAVLAKLIRRGAVSRSDEVSQDQRTWMGIDELSGLRLEYSGKVSHLAQAESVFPSQANAVQTDPKYYYQRGDSTFGPIPAPLLIKLAELEKLSPDDVVWAEGSQERVEARNCAILASAFKTEMGDPEAGAPLPTRRGVRISLWSVGIAAVVAVVAICLISLDSGIQSVRSRQLSSVPTIVKEDNPAVREVGSTKAPSHIDTEIATPEGPIVNSAQDEASIAAAVGFVVVGWHVTFPHGQGGNIALGTGSCFAVNSSGYLLTNQHVVDFDEILSDVDPDGRVRDDARNQNITLQQRIWVFFGGSDHEYNATTLYSNKDFDLAVLKIENAGQPHFALARALGSFRNARVYAAGFPGVGSEALSDAEATKDKIKQFIFNMKLPSDIKECFKTRDFLYSSTDGSVGRVYLDETGIRWIQHEARIRHGNSGGPLYRDDGAVVGINSRLQFGDEADGDVSTNVSLDISQLRKELDSQVPEIAWVSP